MPNDDYRLKKITKLRNKYIAKRDNWDSQYQSSGIGRMSTKYEYEDIIIVCNLAIENLKDECGRCKRTASCVSMLRKKYKELEQKQDTVNVSDVINDLYSIY